jgi:hypothetical protein
MFKEQMLIRRAIWMSCFAVAGLAMPTAALSAGPTFCYIGLALHESAPESSAQEAAAQSASATVGIARDQLHKAAIALSRQFESSTDFQSAELAMLQAFSAYQVARAEVLYTVRQTPEGAAAQVQIDRLERQLDDARLQAKFAGKDHSDQIDAIALALLNQRSAASRREAEALAADERLAGLRYAWLDADARMAELHDSFAQQLHADPQWKSAKAQLEQARTALASISR